MISRLSAQLYRLRSGESGQTLIEYALLASLITIACMLLLAAIGVDVKEVFDEIENAFGLGDPDPVTPPGDDDTTPSL
jgi:Flp pilus assembly pilin Flp